MGDAERINNILEATLLVLEVISASNKIMLEYTNLIQTARNEGRDLTDAELENLKLRRQATVQDFLALGN